LIYLYSGSGVNRDVIVHSVQFL